MNYTILSHEAYGDRQSISFSAGSNINEYLDQVERLLLAAGFHSDTIKDGFIAKADEIELSKAEEDVANEENLHTD